MIGVLFWALWAEELFNVSDLVSMDELCDLKNKGKGDMSFD